MKMSISDRKHHYRHSAQNVHLLIQSNAFLDVYVGLRETRVVWVSLPLSDGRRRVVTLLRVAWL